MLVVMYIGSDGAQTSNICRILRDLRWKVLHLFFGIQF